MGDLLSHLLHSKVTQDYLSLGLFKVVCMTKLLVTKLFVRPNNQLTAAILATILLSSANAFLCFFLSFFAVHIASLTNLLCVLL